MIFGCTQRNAKLTARNHLMGRNELQNVALAAWGKDTTPKYFGVLYACAPHDGARTSFGRRAALIIFEIEEAYSE